MHMEKFIDRTIFKLFSVLCAGLLRVPCLVSATVGVDISHAANSVVNVPGVAVVSVVVVYAERLGAGLANDIAVISVLCQKENLIVDILALATSLTSGPHIVVLFRLVKTVFAASRVASCPVVHLCDHVVVDSFACRVFEGSHGLAVSMGHVEIWEVFRSCEGDRNHRSEYTFHLRYLL